MQPFTLTQETYRAMAAGEASSAVYLKFGFAAQIFLATCPAPQPT